jgi:hypothetical protein
LHYLYLPSEAVASQAARELYEEGYAVERRPSADAHNNPPNPWLVLAKIETIVNEAQVTRARALFTALAVRHGGEYDGWEAATKP